MRLQKNVDAIHALLSLAQTDGNYLQDSWLQVTPSLFLSLLSFFLIFKSQHSFCTLTSALSLQRSTSSHFLSQILLCVSQLERMFLIGTGLPQPLAHVTPPKEMSQRKHEPRPDPPGA